MKKLKSQGLIEDILVNTNCEDSKIIAKNNNITVIDRTQ